VAKLVHYTGDVQGVGFRATASWIAKRHPVRGWVRNLPDGRVELLVDGTDDAIEEFLAEVRSRMAENIASVDTFERDSDAKLPGFHIVP
jgi:acylphosphatase